MTSHLRLVKSFSNADYPYKITINPRDRAKMFGIEYFPPESAMPFIAERQKITRAITMTETSDYRVFEQGGNIDLYFSDEDNFKDMQIALMENDKINHVTEHDLTSIPKRILRHRIKEIADDLNKTPLRNRFALTADHSENTINVTTFDKPAYFALRRIKPEEYVLGIDPL